MSRQTFDCIGVFGPIELTFWYNVATPAIARVMATRARSHQVLRDGIGSSGHLGHDMERTMRNKLVAMIAAGAISMAALGAPTKAEARCWGCWAGAAVGLGLIGGAIAASSGYGYEYGGYGYGYPYGAYEPAYYAPPAYYGYPYAYPRYGYYRPLRPYYGGYYPYRRYWGGGYYGPRYIGRGYYGGRYVSRVRYWR